jgi:hypothetical protein
MVERHAVQQYVLRGVTQDNLKFYHVLRSVHGLGMGNLMRGPPPVDAYTTS